MIKKHAPSSGVRTLLAVPDKTRDSARYCSKFHDSAALPTVSCLLTISCEIESSECFARKAGWIKNDLHRNCSYEWNWQVTRTERTELVSVWTAAIEIHANSCFKKVVVGAQSVGCVSVSGRKWRGSTTPSGGLVAGCLRSTTRPRHASTPASTSRCTQAPT